MACAFLAAIVKFLLHKCKCKPNWSQLENKSC